jgi:hypothetical protein
MSTPLVPETPSAKRRNDDSWQKADVSSVSNKDICPETAQRNQADQTPPTPTLNPPIMLLLLLLKSELREQTTKKQLSPHQNQRKQLMMSSTPSGTLTKERDRS